MEVNTKGRIYFDAIYGFIELTPIEKEIIHSPYYQRLQMDKTAGLFLLRFSWSRTLKVWSFHRGDA